MIKTKSIKEAIKHSIEHGQSTYIDKDGEVWWWIYGKPVARWV